jgi:hypothetical protein
LRNRAVRQTLLCRAEHRVPQEPIADRVARLYAGSAAKPVSVTPDLTFGAPEEFRGAHGGSLTSVHPVVKAAMLAMSRRWPEAIAIDELSCAAGELAGEVVDKESLAGILLAAYGSGLVEFHAAPPRCVSRVSEFPETTALARWQAKQGKLIVTPRHTAVEATGELERRLVALLDGTRDAETLARQLAPAAVRREEVAAILEKLAGFGLLIA